MSDDRPNCNQCSIKGVQFGDAGKSEGVPVKLGDGNCPDCQRVAVNLDPNLVLVNPSEGSRDDKLPFKEGGDHDDYFRYTGRQPMSLDRPYPLTAKQFLKLAIFRSKWRSEDHPEDREA